MFKRKKIEHINVLDVKDNQNTITHSDIYKKGSDIILNNIEDKNHIISQDDKLENARRNLSENKISNENMLNILEYCFQHYEYKKNFDIQIDKDKSTKSNIVLTFTSKVSPSDNPQYIFKIKEQNDKKHLSLSVQYLNSKFYNNSTISDPYISDIDSEIFDKIIKNKEKQIADSYIYNLIFNVTKDISDEDNVDFNDFFDEIDNE